MCFGRLTISTILIFLCAIFPTHSQGLVTQPFPQDGPLLSIHSQAGNYAKNQDYKFYSGAFEFSALLSLSERWIVYASLPIGVTTSENVNGTILGNITLGFGSGLRLGEKGMLIGSLLTTLKSMPSLTGDCHCSDNFWAMYAGWYSDFYRGQRFAANYWSLGPNLQFRYEVSPSITLYTEAWPYWFIPDGSWGHSELWLQNGYGVNAGINQLRGIAEYVSSSWISGNEPSAAIKYEDAIGFGLQAIFDRIRPTLYYQLMLNKEYRRITDGTFGFRLEVVISK